jgi:hypothetical protein
MPRENPREDTMAEPLSETEGCAILARLFADRGYAIKRNLPFREYGVEFHIDGWDAESRVGFEFLTSEDEDHDDLSLEEYKTLDAAQQRGELALFIIDEVEPLTAADLITEAEEFLDEVAAAVDSRRRASLRKRGPTKKRASKKGAAKKVTAKKPDARKATSKPAKKATKKATKKAVKKLGKKPSKKVVAKKRRSRR